MSEPKLDLAEVREAISKVKKEAQRTGERVEIMGIPIIARRISILTYLSSGRVPAHFTNIILNQVDIGGDLTERMTEALQDPKEVSRLAAEMGNFIFRVIEDAVIEPQIIFDSTQVLTEGQMYASDFPEGFLEAVYAWAIAQSPDVSLQGLKGGTAKAVSNFPDSLVN